MPVVAIGASIPMGAPPTTQDVRTSASGSPAAVRSPESSDAETTEASPNSGLGCSTSGKFNSLMSSWRSDWRCRNRLEVKLLERLKQVDHLNGVWSKALGMLGPLGVATGVNPLVTQWRRDTAVVGMVKRCVSLGEALALALPRA